MQYSQMFVSDQLHGFHTPPVYLTNIKWNLVGGLPQNNSSMNVDQF